MVVRKELLEWEEVANLGELLKEELLGQQWEVWLVLLVGLLHPEEALVAAENQEGQGTVAEGAAPAVDSQGVVFPAEDAFPLEGHPMVAEEVDDTTL